MSDNQGEKGKKKIEMVEIRDLLKNELGKFSNINLTLINTTDGLDKVYTSSLEYGEEIDSSKSQIVSLRRREKYENLFIYFGFFFFMFCFGIIVLRRFPLTIILKWSYQIINYIAYEAVSISAPLINKYLSANSSGGNTTDMQNASVGYNQTKADL